MAAGSCLEMTYQAWITPTDTSPSISLGEHKHSKVLLSILLIL
ncbi:uncharacterized protein RCC_04369 [Ramularia collo-cygni]|uniref:Uncharacterized protein n=1 Tax=Ramularia collo-cygni TaxID=112498 RepID=A0A2D3V7J1_9PEZI|nr:uncharacterized protein RCC_04369 [Ramularia collo-cygni]CZT18524.1 uncharacterized protein RCC_04369 [Ramularia collo-cygni]